MTGTEFARGIRRVGHSDLNGHGDGMQVMRHETVLYVGHLGTSRMGTSILDVSDPVDPRVVRQWPAPLGTHSHKVQVAEGVLLTNHEWFRRAEDHEAGMTVYDLADPYDPQPIGYFASGGRGVHRIVWEGGRYAYLSGILEGYTDRIWLIVDMSDPSQPSEAGRWWWPGLWKAGGETPDWDPARRHAAHHALVAGKRAYLGHDDAGLVILDISDCAAPRTVSTLSWRPGGSTHTCLPLGDRGLLAVTDEAVVDDCEEEEKLIRIIDISDERRPRVLSICPPPDRAFCKRGLRFGPHNLHENRPGTYRSHHLIFATYFNAGLRVYDLSDPVAPREVACWIPTTPPGQRAVQTNDLLVERDGMIYVTDRISGGLYILEPEPDLRAAMDDLSAGDT